MKIVLPLLCHFEHDREQNVAYLSLKCEPADREKIVAQTIHIGEDVLFDIDEHGHLVGIELLNASKWL
jgi:uncharacterized protein YuzE